MTNNDVLRRVRDLFELSDTQVIALFGAAGPEVTRDEVSNWLKEGDDPAGPSCDDTHLAAFLNGLIEDRRGKREGARPAPETSLTNNGVLRKLKIALDLQADEMLAILALADVQISKHELSALFRKPAHKHYRACKDELLSSFFEGLELQRRQDG